MDHNTKIHIVRKLMIRKKTNGTKTLIGPQVVKSQTAATERLLTFTFVIHYTIEWLSVIMTD